MHLLVLLHEAGMIFLQAFHLLFQALRILYIITKITKNSYYNNNYHEAIHVLVPII